MPLKLTKQKASRHWYIRGTVRGQPIYESTGTDNAEAADEIRVKREGELLKCSIHGEGATVTFEKAADSYLKAGGEAKYLGHYDGKKWTLLLGEFYGVAVGAIGTPEADAAAEKLYPGTALATRKRQAYGPLKAVLQHAAEKWNASVRVINSPKIKVKPVQFATPDMVQRLLAQCSGPLSLFVTISVYTGERLEQVIGLDWDRDIDLSGRWITFHHTKNGEMRTVGMHDEVLIALAAVPAEQRHGRLFHWSHKTHVHKPLRTAFKRAGVPYLSPHKVGRHTHATWLRRYSKRDLRGVMEDIGFKSINSAVRYLHTVPGETAAALKLLPSVSATVENPCSSKSKTGKALKVKRKIA